MWIPRSWQDLELAIGVQIEGESLDFKKALPPKAAIRDLAKDAAAMSIGGGVIVVGVDESQGVATAITPIELAGAVERVQQVIDAYVAPAVAVKITPIRENEDDDTGVLVIAVSASWSAPHQYEHRFPARAGSTTRYLAEREIEALYARRWELREEGNAHFGIQGHSLPPGVRLDLGGAPVGVLRLHVRPPSRLHTPEEPYLGQPLRNAVAAAAATTSQFIHPEFHPASFDLLRSWAPAGPYGWSAGKFLQGGQVFSVMVGGMYTYGNGLSFTVTLDLSADLGPDAPEGARCAQEHHWAIETMALLAIAGQFFDPVAEASLLRVDLELGGLLDSVSWQASKGLAFGSGAPKVTENLYLAGDLVAARELAEDPRAATRALLDPFMIAILGEGSDLLSWVGKLSY